MFINVIWNAVFYDPFPPFNKILDEIMKNVLYSTNLTNMVRSNIHIIEKCGIFRLKYYPLASWNSYEFVNIKRTLPIV